LQADIQATCNLQQSHRQKQRSFHNCFACGIKAGKDAAQRSKLNIFQHSRRDNSAEFIYDNTKLACWLFLLEFPHSLTPHSDDDMVFPFSQRENHKAKRGSESCSFTDSLHNIYVTLANVLHCTSLSL